MARYTAADRFPSAMLMIARHGKVAYWKAFGVRDRDSNDPLQRNDIFRIYSLTKPVVVTAVLMLMEEGKLSLDDPVEQFIPVLARLRVQDASGAVRAPRQKLMIRHLLTYTSGFTYGLWGTGSMADSAALAANLFANATSLDDLMNRVADLPLVADPGVAVSYGWQADVLGRIVEVVGGRPLDRFIAERVLTPLGMKETGFLVPTGLESRVPALYAVAAGHAPERQPLSAWNGGYGSPPRVLWGGHGLASTPADYIRFAQMIANKGELDGVRLLKSTSVEMMTRAQVSPELPSLTTLAGPGVSIGFGCFVAIDIEKAGGGGHNGLFYFSGAANLFVWTDRMSGIVGMVWAQAMPFQLFPLFPDVRRAVNAATVR